MSVKSSGALVCALVVLSLVLPACGGDEAAAPQPASEAAPADDLRVLERRVGGLERHLRELREQIESRGSNEQPSRDEGGEETAGNAVPPASGPAGGDTAGAGASGAAGAASGAAGGGSTGSGGGSTGSGGGSTGSGGGSGSGSGGGGSGGGGSGSGGGGSRSGGGGSGSGGSQDPTIEDICGPNPAPEC